MKKVILALAVVALSATGAFAQLKDGKFNIDYKTSTINWYATKATGKHDGTVRVSSGQVTVAGGNVTAGKVKVDMNSIAVTDIKDAETNANLVNHLKSPDFFEVAKFPDANFEVTSVTAKADKATGNTHVVNGKMTIKGIAQEVSFPAKVTGTDASLTINGTLVLDRSKFDIRFGSETFFGSLGDKAISNDMKLVVNLIANKK
jgi:polyisoprenoid-binding protein YceI